MDHSCNKCGVDCSGLCQIEIRNVVFVFNSCGMICRSMAGTKIKEKIRLDDDTLEWFIDAATMDISNREETKQDIRAEIKKEHDWPTCAFMLDDKYVAWCVEAECEVDREANADEVAVFICAAVRSVDNKDAKENDNDDNDKNE